MRPAALFVFLYARLLVKHSDDVSEVECFLATFLLFASSYGQNSLRNVQHKVSQIELAELEKLLRADMLVEVAFMSVEGKLCRFFNCLRSTFDFFLTWIGESCYS